MLVVDNRLFHLLLVHVLSIEDEVENMVDIEFHLMNCHLNPVESKVMDMFRVFHMDDAETNSMDNDQLFFHVRDDLANEANV